MLRRGRSLDRLTPDGEINEINREKERNWTKTAAAFAGHKTCPGTQTADKLGLTNTFHNVAHEVK